MIQAEHITKTFHGFKALDDMSLHVPKGTIYGLVGPNGAGKSTLIRHLTGIYRPDCGSILIDGLPVYDNPEAKAKFTYIPDDLFYFLQADTLEMKRFYQGIYQKFDTALFDRLQEFFPDYRHQTQHPQTLQRYAETGRFLAVYLCHAGTDDTR